MTDLRGGGREGGCVSSEMPSVKSFPEIRFFFQISLLGDRICKTELID